MAPAITVTKSAVPGVSQSVARHRDEANENADSAIAILRFMNSNPVSDPFPKAAPPLRVALLEA
jgi:hypothetical protein